jgi:hypothetical protein
MQPRIVGMIGINRFCPWDALPAQLLIVILATWRIISPRNRLLTLVFQELILLFRRFSLSIYIYTHIGFIGIKDYKGLYVQCVYTYIYIYI